MYSRLYHVVLFKPEISWTSLACDTMMHGYSEIFLYVVRSKYGVRDLIWRMFLVNWKKSILVTAANALAQHNQRLLSHLRAVYNDVPRVRGAYAFDALAFAHKASHIM